MSDTTSTTSSGTVPPTIARVLSRFQAMAREEKMQALVHYSKKLEPLPERFATIERDNFSVPECQTRVDIFPEFHDGKMHFYADLNVRQSPTIAAFLAITFAAINDQPPETTLAIPGDYVQQLMEGIGLSGREVGLNAMVARIKRYAEQARAQADAKPK
jgi:cysteine desulfuration protein SufE